MGGKGQHQEAPNDHWSPIGQGGPQGEQKKGARRQIGDQGNGGRTPGRPGAHQAQEQGLDGDQDEDQIDDMPVVKQLRHKRRVLGPLQAPLGPPTAYLGETMPSRWARSLKKMRAWAVGLARTSRLFM